MPVLLPKMVPERNLLTEWLKRVRLQNSDLSIKRMIRAPDEDLVTIHNFLDDFFGTEYFQADAFNMKSFKIMAKDSPWLLQLLANDDYPSLLQIFETCHILAEMESNHPDVCKQLKSNSRNQAFRNYLFEAVTYHLLRTNKIPYTGKTVINGKEKEGFLSLAGKEFLFECKKLYTYQMPGIAFIFSIHEEFFRLWHKSPVPINCYITISVNNEAVLRATRNAFDNAFKEFFQSVKETKNICFDKEIRINDNKPAVGRVLIEPYHEGIFKNYTQTIKETAVCFAVQPYRPGTMDDKSIHIHGTHILFKCNMLSSASVDFLISKLDKKRKSQSDMKHMARIFLFDNEIYRGTELSLFQSEETMDGTKLQEYVNSKDTDDIVCILFRKYFLSSIPSWGIKVFCKPALEPYKKEIEQWIPLYQQASFVSKIPKHL